MSDLRDNPRYARYFKEWKDPYFLGGLIREMADRGYSVEDVVYVTFEGTEYASTWEQFVTAVEEAAARGANFASVGLTALDGFNVVAKGWIAVFHSHDTGQYSSWDFTTVDYSRPNKPFRFTFEPGYSGDMKWPYISGAEDAPV